MKKNSPIFYVYILIDPSDNIPFYVGKGNGSRMYDHEKNILKGKKLKNLHLYYKISKILDSKKPILYNKVLENVDENTALIEEINQIQKIGRADLGLGTLCNLTNGGEGSCGLVYTDKMLKRRIELSAGKNNPMFGHKHTDEAKKIMSIKRRSRNFEYKHSTDHKLKMKIFNPGGLKTSIPIYQIDDIGNIVKEWKSSREAAKNLGVSHSNIWTCLKKHRNWKCGGFLWKFVNQK
jgi:hypothetical protein